jgi:bifunctional UDP-N-acetylglucosamine pyrophosphorylase/glucosamine-1-phosphate N-acetyltransferase
LRSANTRTQRSEELAVDFCNGGIITFSGAQAMSLLEAIGNDNAKGEYYLTDIVEIARARGLRCVAIEAPEEDMMGCNTRAELAEIEQVWQAAPVTGQCCQV